MLIMAFPVPRTRRSVLSAPSTSAELSAEVDFEIEDLVDDPAQKTDQPSL